MPRTSPRAGVADARLDYQLFASDWGGRVCRSVHAYRDRLQRYGLDAAQAQCVGQRLEANLSIGQLQQLARAGGALQQGDTTPGRLTSGDLLRAASQINDPKVAVEVARAANGCGVLAAGL